MFLPVIQLDLRQSRHWEITTQPDILILPSRLAPIAKDLNNTLIINPGFLAKGRGGGTFADIVVSPLPNNRDDVGTITVQSVSERASVQIKKI